MAVVVTSLQCRNCTGVQWPQCFFPTHCLSVFPIFSRCRGGNGDASSVCAFNKDAIKAGFEENVGRNWAVPRSCDAYATGNLTTAVSLRLYQRPVTLYTYVVFRLFT